MAKEFEQNAALYRKPHVVEYYDGLEGLDAPEVLFFGKYIPPGSSVLDLGVGGGRTTPYLSEKAATYTGFDLSAPLIEVCRRKFPALKFLVGNAVDLGAFDDASQDVVVFSFNGIDYLTPIDQRHGCFKEILRVLKPGGVFIFSTHNSRNLMALPQLSGASPIQFVYRLLRMPWVNLKKAAEKLRSRCVWDGFGYYDDGTHGGIYTFSTTVECQRKALENLGFEYVDHVSSLYPSQMKAILVPWFYYVFRKPGR